MSSCGFRKLSYPLKYSEIPIMRRLIVQKLCAGEFGNFELKNLKGICKKIYSFPQRSIDTWNGLKGRGDKGKHVHKLQEKLDKHRHRERTTHEK